MFGMIFCLFLHCYFIAISIMTLIINYLIAIYTIFIIVSLLYFILLLLLLSSSLYYLICLLFINCNDDLCVISFAKESVERAILHKCFIVSIRGKADEAQL